MNSESEKLMLREHEKEIAANLKKTGIYLLDKSICSFQNAEPAEMIVSISNMQISMELLLKAYVCQAYGFENILTKGMCNERNNNPTKYLEKLGRHQIKTLSFFELKRYIKEHEDTFAPVIEEGVCPCFGVEYDYLKGLFEKFQSIRNAFIHLGIMTSNEDIKWLSTDFFVMLIVFISLLLRELDKLEENLEEGETYTPSVEADEESINLCFTPIDILIRHLSEKAIQMLRNNSAFLDNLCDFALDAYDSNVYVCPNCKKEAMFLDVYDGFSKCVSCGTCFEAAYADCAICNSEKTVVYDHLNISFNMNVMPGFCYQCQKHPKVYQCPVCGNTYTYSHKTVPTNFFFECCKEHFHDRSIPVFEDC